MLSFNALMLSVHTFHGRHFSQKHILQLFALIISCLYTNAKEAYRIIFQEYRNSYKWANSLGMCIVSNAPNSRGLRWKLRISVAHVNINISYHKIWVAIRCGMTTGLPARGGSILPHCGTSKQKWRLVVEPVRDFYSLVGKLLELKKCLLCEC